MECKQAISEIVEGARKDAGVSPNVTGHLQSCGSCREYLASQQALSRQLAQLRVEDYAFGDNTWRRAVLMREYDANLKREKQVRWMWALSTAAVLVISVVAVKDIWVRPTGSPVTEVARRDYAQEPFAPAEQAGETGFVKVPFAMPTAPGETLGIVRTQMDAEALANMGVNVDPELVGSVQVDLLVGEDGMTQAVRLPGSGESSAF